MKDTEWKEFEIAVKGFVAALDPRSEVTHNASLPDIHTGKPRQRDVWVETKVCQHFPIKALISCKREKRKMDQQGMDAFIGELSSSGANLGVVYSYSGFSANAIQKAKKLNISCCRLYQNEPPDIPNSLIFSSSYCCTPRISLDVVAPLDTDWDIKQWNDLFKLVFKNDGIEISVLDHIVNSYFESEKKSIQGIDRERLIPQAWEELIVFKDDHPGKEPLNMLIQGRWKIYEGQIEAYLIDGSYNFTSNEFIGSQAGPVVDLHSSHPGPGWKLLEELSSLRPTQSGLTTVFILTGGNAKEALLDNLGQKEICAINMDLSKLEKKN